MIKLGINGFGRIGRMVFRAAVENFASDIEVVGINDLLDPEYLAYMLKYDSVHGQFQGDIKVENGNLIVNGKCIRVTAEMDPANLKWNEVGAEVVVESTGFFLTDETARKHIQAGAKKVGKAIGDAFNGPFRKGDQIVMKGEDGESFKGTITNWDGSEKTYEVMLGKAVSESFDPEYDGEDEEWIDGVPDLGDAVYFQGSRIPKQDIYMELQDCGVDCYDDAEFDEYCKSNQKKVYGLLSDMCYAYPVNEGL